MSNRKKQTILMQSEPNNELKVTPSLIQIGGQHLAECIAQEQSLHQLRHQEQQRTVPKPIFTTKDRHHHKNNNYSNAYQMCSKYNYCHKDREGAHFHKDEEELDFSVPSIILTDEVPLDIDVRPVKMVEVVDQIDSVVQANIMRHRKEEHERKKEEEKIKEEKRKKLQKLNQRAKEGLKKCPKASLSEEKRAKWGHSLYNDKKQEQKIQQQENHRTVRKSQTKNRQSSLEPVQQRIKNYKQKQQQITKKHEEEVQCRHKHVNPDKMQRERETEIERNAERIMRDKRKKEEEQEERKKCIEGKIRAIQIQSKEGLKKFKKKPVDPTIDFIVDIPENNKNGKKEKKKKIDNKQQQNIDPNHRQKNFLRRDTSKSSPLLQKTKQSRQKFSKTQRSVPSSQQENSQPNRAQFNEEEQKYKNHPYGSKFYIWNIPIHQQDIDMLDSNYMKTIDFENKKQAKKSFRDEVNQHLENKFHKNMQEENKKMRMSKFEEMVSEKKRELIQQFDQQQYEGEARKQFGEVFWNEDILFKRNEIANFTYQ